jgi:flagellar protein FlbD
MIRVSRLDGTEFVVNAELIKLIESTPDTVLSLTDDAKFVVREPLDEVVARVIVYRRSAYAALPVHAASEVPAQG